MRVSQFGFCFLFSLLVMAQVPSFVGLGTKLMHVKKPVLSAWASTTPLIDGKLTPEYILLAMPHRAEWEDADRVSFVLSWGGVDHNASLYVMNDYLNLYIAFTIETEDHDVGDYLWINFDNDHDGSKAVGDNVLYLDGHSADIETFAGRFQDGFWLSPGAEYPEVDKLHGGSNNGVAACKFTGPKLNGSYVFELAQPLNTDDDAHDFSLGIGDTVGFNVLYMDAGGGPGSEAGWPTLTKADWSQMADIRIAGPPLPPAPSYRNLKIDKIEITQAIQWLDGTGYEDNSLSLVQGKSTIVRVYTNNQWYRMSNVEVQLYATISGWSRTLPGLYGANGPLHQVFDVPTIPDRGNGSHTANFLLPDYWVMNSHVTLTAFLKAPPMQSETDYTDNWMTEQTFYFTATKDLKIGYYRIDYRPTAPDENPNLPSTDKLLNGKLFFEKVTPVPDLSCSVTYYELGPPIPWDKSNFTQPCEHDGSPHAWDDNRTAQRELLHYLRVQYNDLVVFGEAPDQICGLYANALTSTGRVYEIPGKVFIAHEDRPWSFAHEIGHNYGLNHSWDDANNPWNGTLAVNSSQTYGFDTQEDWLPDEPGDTAKIPASNDSERNTKYGALMSYYDSHRWISPYEWEYLFGAFIDPPPLASQGYPVQSAVLSSTPSLQVSGVIYKNNTGTLHPIFQLPSFPNVTLPSGPYTLELRGASPAEQLLYSQSFDMTFEPDEPCAMFLLNLPLTTGVYSVSLLNSSISPSVLLDKITASANPPQVTITSPNGGETLGDAFNVTWTAEDSDSDPLTFKLLYSNDLGATWCPIAQFFKWLDLEMVYRIDASRLPGGPNSLFRLLVSDGFHTNEDQSDTAFTVSPKPPLDVVGIGIGPCMHYDFGDPVVLKGYAFDPEDGVLEDSALTWSSNVSGILGTGRAFTTTDLLPGAHNITLTATDSDDNNSTHSFTVTVELHDVAVIDVAPTKMIIGEGYNLTVNVTLQNQGLSSETLDLTLIMGKVNVTSINVDLFGSATSGWGFDLSSMASPGPTITVNQWDLVRLTLHSADSLTHNFFIDYNGDALPTPGEPTSPDFTTTAFYQFVPGTSGTFTYYCQYHSSIMFGTFIVGDPTILSYYQDAIETIDIMPDDNYTIREHHIPCLIKGYHLISYSAGPVPKEMDLADNLLVGGIAYVGAPGDVNADGYVGIDDIFTIASHFAQDPTHPEWQPTYDINDDEYIGIDDIFIAASHFGEE